MDILLVSFPWYARLAKWLGSKLSRWGDKRARFWTPGGRRVYL